MACPPGAQTLSVHPAAPRSGSSSTKADQTLVLELLDGMHGQSFPDASSKAGRSRPSSELRNVGRRRGGGPPVRRWCSDPADMAAAGPPMQRVNRGLRLFENSPMMQSVVDQVVFGRDMDQSGDGQFDPEFIVMFEGCAGRPSWQPPANGKLMMDELKVPGMREVHAARRGRRTYFNAPLQQSIVDQVVFGRDIDQSGDAQFDTEFMEMYQGSAGRPSWKVPPTGVRTFHGEQVQSQQVKLRPLGTRQRQKQRRSVAGALGLARFAAGTAGHQLKVEAPCPPVNALMLSSVDGAGADGGRQDEVTAGRGPMASLIARWADRKKAASSFVAAASAQHASSAVPMSALTSLVPVADSRSCVVK